MTDWNPQANDLFLRARELSSGDERRRFLDDACAGDTALRGDVDGLLEAIDRAGSFLERPAPELDATRDASPVTERPGTVIGPYRLLEQIGDGGFGVVFMAEQTHPVRRKVALKVLKPGMDTGQVVARFEAERQALALMDHPNIAKVHDGGSTEAGRPYFVMEWVRGVPVTEFCDRNHLPVRERLELFVSVCHAVQHAHQKGVIHRDLKPTNVLVTLHDGVPVAKVIDFGVAKATGQPLTERTLFTNFAQMVGTPLYMSPEQAEMSGLDVDTRADIYALGVLLYELLTGTTPVDRDRFRTVGFDEIRRIIREEEPARPSTRISTLGTAAATVSANRGSEPRKLSAVFRGELDWIVMRCLEKDRNRRYESAAGLAADVRRYLADEPVQACPPSAAYRFRKFARRNRRALVGSVASGLMLLVAAGAVAGSFGWALGDREARRTATAARCDQLLQESESAYRAGRPPEATDAGRKAHELAESGGGDDESRRRVRAWLADLDMVARLEDIRARWNDLFTPWFRDYPGAFRTYGIDLDTLPPAEAVTLIAASPIRMDLAVALDDWARHDGGRAPRLRAVAAAADPDPIRARLRELASQSDPAPLRDLAESLDVIAVPVPVLDLVGQRLWSAGDEAGAIAFLRRVQLHHPGDYRINLALAHASYGAKTVRSLDDAIRFYTAAIAVRSNSDVAHYFLGRSFFLKGNRDESLAVYRRLVAINPQYPTAHHKLSGLLVMKGRLDEAVEVARATPPGAGPDREEWVARLLNDRAWQLAAHPNVPARDPGRAVALAGEAVARNPAAGANWETLGVARYRADDWKGAADALEKWARLQPPGDGAGAFVLAMAYSRLGRIDEARDRLDRAVRWMDQNRPDDSVLLQFRVEALAVLAERARPGPPQ
ncbi:MAG TPA: protein kinase [Gemmataceae bacterium]|nr:protein kinase [Gemmataceae bacterium]